MHIPYYYVDNSKVNCLSICILVWGFSIIIMILSLVYFCKGSRYHVLTPLQSIVVCHKRARPGDYLKLLSYYVHDGEVLYVHFHCN